MANYDAVAAWDTLMFDIAHGKDPVEAMQSMLANYDDTFEPVKWDDWRAPATAINPPGKVSDPDVETSSGLLRFAASGTELVYVLMQLPHSWAKGTDIVPHVHWTKTTSAAGDAAWNLKYKLIPIGEVGDAAWTDLGIADTPVPGTPDNDTAWEHLITSWGAQSFLADKDISDCILWELTRLGSDAADTYGADARLLEFDVHLQLDSNGSRAQFEKDNV